jgi:uncharacterized protein (AIM24 family)
MTKRVRGRLTQEPFGSGDDAMCFATGTGVVVVSPRGGRFTALALDKELIYLRESAVFAFEDSLLWEHGRIPGGGPGGMQVLQLAGEGRLVVRTRRAPYTLGLGGGEVFYVEQEALLGWLGSVIPQQMKGADGAPTQFIVCNGEGTLILEEQSAQPAQP